MSGTSMAAPHVAGVAALWAQREIKKAGKIKLTSLRSRLIGSGTRQVMPKNISIIDIGSGIVQAPIDK